MRIAIVSREVYPLASGGIGAYVTSLANALTAVAEVTVVTSDAFEERHRELQAMAHSGLPADDVRIVFVPEPRESDIGSHLSFIHLYSARVLDTLREVYADGAPDVVEFSDYLGEGAVTIQAARTHDPLLRDTTMVVKLHSTMELVDVLNGRLSEHEDARATYALERFALRHADQLLFGGGDVGPTYERFYGRPSLAPSRPLRQPVPDARAWPVEIPDDVLDGSAPVRLLYFGRLERRKGVQNLIRALAGRPGGDFRLTLVGGDTDTAPLRISMRQQLGLMVADDPRIHLVGAVDRREIPFLLAEHHVVVIPSLWECWPNVGLEALRANRPILATPVGGLGEMASEGGGWRASGTSPADLTAAIEQLLDHDRAEIGRLVAEGAPRRRFAELTEVEPVLEAYGELARRRPRGVHAERHAHPLVSVIVPYFRLDRYISETVDSIFAQTYPNLEVILVNDGSLREEDRVIAELARRYPIRVVTQVNAGLSAARNLGIRVSRGRYVLPLDADNVIEPGFVARCVEVLERDPKVAYVTSWSRYIAEDGKPHEDPGGGYQPLGNSSELVHSQNVAGDAIAVLRRRLFDLGFEYDVDLTSYEDWVLYRELHVAGYFGHAIPDRLIRYRIRPMSMLRQIGVPRQAWLDEEMNAHMRRRQIEWTS